MINLWFLMRRPWALDEVAAAMTTDRCETYRCHKAAHEAYVRGDIEALREALSNPPDFPNCRQPFDIAVGDHPLEYAIYWSPAGFVAELIRLGADPNTSIPPASHR